MSDRMIRTQLINLLVAGNETTRNLLGSLFYRHRDRSGVQKQLRADPIIDGELGRRDAAARVAGALRGPTLPRTTELEGEEVEPGDTVLVSIEAANRDAAAFDHPDELRPAS